MGESTIHASENFRIHHADCLQLDHLEPNGIFDFIYLDPPSLINDALGDFLIPRVECSYQHLQETGFLLIHLESSQVQAIKSRVDALGVPFKGDFIWTYRLRSVAVKSLQPQHDTILVYSANPSYHPKRLLFGQSVIGPSSNERVGYPEQKPVDLLKRMIRRLEGYHRIETILDPMMGSGTTLVAGLELGKTVVGFDTSATACAITEKRLQQSLPATRQLELDLGFEL